MTNFDRFYSKISSNYLSRLLSYYYENYLNCNNCPAKINKDCKEKYNCKDVFREWLYSEVEE